MKLKTIILLTSAVASQAAVVTTNPGAAAGAHSNFWNATMAAGDSTSFSGDFSSWAWHDTDLGSNVGWRHTADWFELTLTTDALITFELNRVTDGPNSANAESLFPSFTLYRGISDISDLNDGDAVNEDRHIFNNIADTQIHPDAIVLEYVGHVDNTTESSASQSFTLTAGSYTFAMGGNTASQVGLTALPTDYSATISAAAIPEPSSLVLIAISSIGLLRRRR
ncbi:PEP-CTERM sorting domain-containing protein [Roseibacillus persicicus]|uniref:Ice-binding protein C-terminal domain-containing protein n=1 Tax=Roseibacillus persicicus TaxID=454148 RepID=A0A918WGF9_9BACT|nr:PEP-CTERM sorting domain-containing protein [Roseibacillus persicicus]GHC44335.1 hypothetical protein GCM10007100_07010 [Roseibacillus persicicus]